MMFSIKLQKYHPDPTHVLDWSTLDIEEDVTVVEAPIRILDRREKQLRGKTIPLVRVLWKHRGMEEETWEHEAEMCAHYPDLFEDEQP